MPVVGLFLVIWPVPAMAALVPVCLAAGRGSRARGG